MKNLSEGKMGFSPKFENSFNSISHSMPEAVSIYDVEEKKLVLVFQNKTAAGVYVLDKSKNISGSAVSKIIGRKGKTVSKYFNRLVAFRIASDEHKKLLGDNVFICLDDKYKRTEFTHKMVSEFNKR